MPCAMTAYEQVNTGDTGMHKICHMTSAHPPGDTRIFHKECVSLAKAGYEVYLVERGDSYDQQGVHVVGVGQPSGGRLNRMTDFARKVYEAALAVDADVYHFHDPELLPYGLKLKKKGKKVIFDSHELYAQQLRKKPYLPSWCTRLIARGYAAYENHAVRRLDAVIFPCTIAGKNPFAGKCQRAVLVDNSVMLDEMYQKYDPSAEKIPNQVCMVGSLTKTRGITETILAGRKTGCVLALAGKFAPAEYESQLRAMPEFSCVDYKGVLPLPQVTKLLQESMLGVCLLLDVGQYWLLDNLPTKVGEYMSMGLPTVIHGSPFNRRFIEEYHCGICVDPTNVQEVADAIRYLLDHPEEAREMGLNGRRAVKERFNWGVEAVKLLELYRELLPE